jgi:SAM-dependent methyltransferase
MVVMNSLKASLNPVIPDSYRKTWRNWKRSYRDYQEELQAQWRGWQYAGDRKVCPCCGGKFREFLTYGVDPRPEVMCPRCSSLERHRLLWLYLQNKTNFFRDSLKVLHIAPEQWFQKKFKALPNLDYLSSDLEAEWAMEKMDLTDIHYPEASFDVILCNHVLEHIPDDAKAMRELYRVLKPGGWAILQVPLDPKRATTYEDFSITSPQEREKAFGQFDHVRVYGQDYGDRLAAAGFNVKRDRYVQEDLSEAERQTYALRAEEDIYFCSK